ncbi:hypothetical protein SARC_03130 [Sphaeroforma arctica JP610]|uniref:Uncharacterized protein n=1 Tax=Sphaeroforma arctica JP610 TaxID=667725 RepID=A0A0L0G6W8_9EUKA|nr:hypothetical protein SARC_03130 [Sphaeroforma arctica JP610]KNC84669.1 hypothetical protein SARC_03130 [Sphaeroforma arctica JP610]|eukprot:XP_014158571.1 hypothetical protein SARC_03130 [Sphaeroforma arctica JP610]
MTISNTTQPLLNDTDSGFISSDTSDNMPALLPNSSSAYVRIQGQANRVGQHNRIIQYHVHRQVDRLDERGRRLEDIEVNSQETLRTSTIDITTDNRNRENVVREQKNRTPTTTLTWTLRTMLQQEERTEPWASISERESTQIKKDIQQNKEGSDEL